MPSECGAACASGARPSGRIRVRQARFVRILWRRMHTSDQGSVFSQGYYGIYHIVEYSLLLGVKLRDVPPDIGIRQQVLAKHGLPARG
jgi:hypothetical protein